MLNIEDSVDGYCYKDFIGAKLAISAKDEYTACNQIFEVTENEKYNPSIDSDILKGDLINE